MLPRRVCAILAWCYAYAKYRVRQDGANLVFCHAVPLGALQDGDPHRLIVLHFCEPVDTADLLLWQPRQPVVTGASAVCAFAAV